MDDRSPTEQERQAEQARLDAERQSAEAARLGQPDPNQDQGLVAAQNDPNAGELPADAPIPQVPESALPQDPQPAVPVPANAMPGTDAEGDPVEPQESGATPASTVTPPGSDQAAAPAPPATSVPPVREDQ